MCTHTHVCVRAHTSYTYIYNTYMRIRGKIHGLFVFNPFVALSQGPAVVVNVNVQYYLRLCHFSLSYFIIRSNHSFIKSNVPCEREKGLNIEGFWIPHTHTHNCYPLHLQSLLRLKEPAVLLRCRKMDKELIESILDAAKKDYAEKAKTSAPKIAIDDRVYLPPPPSDKDFHGPSCSGGVVLASQDGRIVCENTLDARLDVVFRQKLPEIRKLLFSKMDV